MTLTHKCALFFFGFGKDGSMDNLILAITVALVICIVLILYRLAYIRGFKAGGKVGAEKVLAEWKAVYSEEEREND